MLRKVGLCDFGLTACGAMTFLLTNRGLRCGVVTLFVATALESSASGVPAQDAEPQVLGLKSTWYDVRTGGNLKFMVPSWVQRAGMRIGFTSRCSSANGSVQCLSRIVLWTSPRVIVLHPRQRLCSFSG